MDLSKPEIFENRCKFFPVSSAETNFLEKKLALNSPCLAVYLESKTKTLIGKKT
jgi:hypothetical protein